MDRRQLRAVIFLTMATATMCVAPRPGPAHAAVARQAVGGRAGAGHSPQAVQSGATHSARAVAGYSARPARSGAGHSPRAVRSEATHSATAGRSGAAPRICRSWEHHGKIAARLSRGIHDVLRRRDSIVAIRVQDPYLGIGCWYREGRHFDSASAVKVTILGALLRKAHTEHRGLTARERWLAWRMITESDNGAATALWDDVGRYRLGRFLRLTGMRQTVLGPTGYWGLTRITAHDELVLLRHLLQPNPVLTKAARRYELRLMAHVIPAQRWGVAAGVPDSFTVHVKNGWAPLAPFHGWFVNSIGCFTRAGHDYSLVVLTQGNPSMGYGVATVQSVAEVINRGLNPGARGVIARSGPFPSWGRPDEPAAG